MTNIHVDEIIDIDAPGCGYAGWPTLAKTRSGELLAVYSGGRRHHVCPFGQVHIIASRDEGRSWTWPRTLIDGPLDDRDAGVLETAKGTLIVNWFTSVAWELVMDNHPGILEKYPEAEQAEWQRRRARLTDEVRQREMGAWCIRSEDGGQTWSPKIPTLVNSPHGPCELSDGRLLYVGKKVAANYSDGNKGGPFGGPLGVAESSDDGQSWQLIGEIPTLPGHEASGYHELHAVQAADGSLIAHIRNHNELHQHETLQTESHDGGRTWSVPHPIGVWGYPAFLMRTSDGRFITTVGHRRQPEGNQIAISEDNGQTWSDAIPLNTDSSGDYGYPSTVELTPGKFFSLWYDRKGGEVAGLRLARWRLG